MEVNLMNLFKPKCCAALTLLFLSAITSEASAFPRDYPAPPVMVPPPPVVVAPAPVYRPGYYPPPPPPLRYEAAPRPRRGYVWEPGHWVWSPRGYIWRQGRWRRW
ncbi:YXWGXW repeat-containing protein [Acetobacter syzygii]|uniref:YXWGXW repeat-containing protein n=2 Tax=Acetobacter syzygii TaxID=146476 RepID=UPI0039EB5524